MVPVTGNLIVPSSEANKIDILTIPASHYKTGVPNADLVVYVGAESDKNSNYLAYASGFILQSSNNRPIFGFIVFNLAYLNTNLTDFQVL